MLQQNAIALLQICHRTNRPIGRNKCFLWRPIFSFEVNQFISSSSNYTNSNVFILHIFQINKYNPHFIGTNRLMSFHSETVYPFNCQAFNLLMRSIFQSSACIVNALRLLLLFVPFCLCMIHSRMPLCLCVCVCVQLLICCTLLLFLLFK